MNNKPDNPIIAIFGGLACIGFYYLLGLAMYTIL